MKNVLNHALLATSLCAFLLACGGLGSEDSTANLEEGVTCSTSTQCARGLECEVEHGVGSCQPHGKQGMAGGDDTSGGRDESATGGGSSGGKNSGSGGASGVDDHGSGGSDDDHGSGGSDDDPNTTGGLDDHGGAGRSGGAGGVGAGNAGGLSGGSAGATSARACQTSADCAPGEQCESEHGALFCKAHGGK